MGNARIAVVADDLTGAADTGIGFVHAGFRAALLTAPLAAPPAGADVVAVDTDTRAGPPDAAARIIERTVAAFARQDVEVCYLKVDSMLRGHPAVSTDAALRAYGPDTAAIVAPAFPRTGRTTVAGRQRVHGEPLPIPALTELFAIGGRRVVHLSLPEVRDPALGDYIAGHRLVGATVFVCDAEDDADLAAIANAGQIMGAGRNEPGLVWVGSGGLAAALAPTLPRPDHDVPRSSFSLGGPVLVAVGSMAPVAAAQVESLAAELSHVPVSSDASADRVGALLRDGHSVVATLAGPAPGAADGDPRLASEFARRIAPYLDHAGALVATGGDTARALLRASGIDRLDLVAELEPGVVLTVAADRDLPIVTKAGSFGDAATLTTAVRRLTNPKGPTPCLPSLPRLPS